MWCSAMEQSYMTMALKEVTLLKDRSVEKDIALTSFMMSRRGCWKILRRKWESQQMNAVTRYLHEFFWIRNQHFNSQTHIMLPLNINHLLSIKLISEINLLSKAKKIFKNHNLPTTQCIFTLNVKIIMYIKLLICVYILLVVKNEIFTSHCVK